jgi:Family of unknown function (DUF6920)
MWTSNVLGFLAIGLTAVLGYVWFQSRRLDREHRSMAEGLIATARTDRGEVLTGSHYESLPAPVRRYLPLVIPEGRPRLRCIRLTQTGTFRTRDEPAQWQPFRAVQHVVTAPPGFVWDATIRMAPLLSARVLDSYRNGAGWLRARLLGVFTVAEASGPETDSGEMMRYLAEAIWYPTALLPDERLRWQAVDEHSAVAFLRDRGLEVAVTFHFDEEGLVDRSEAERFRIEQGHTRKVRWRAYCSGYEVRGGFRIPLQARVAWCLPEGEQEYFRGRIESIEYDP